MGTGNLSVEWMKETIEDVPKDKFFFKFICFISGRRKRKITYEELYIIYCNVYDKGNETLMNVKEKAMEKVLEIYYFNNKRLPKNIKNGKL